MKLFTFHFNANKKTKFKLVVLSLKIDIVLHFVCGCSKCRNIKNIRNFYTNFIEVESKYVMIAYR